MTRVVQVGLGPGYIVLDGDPAPVPKKRQSPPISAHFYCGQTAGCIKIPLDTELGLSPGDFVLDGDVTQLPSPKRGQSPLDPQFSAHFYCGQTVGCIKMPLCMEVGLGPNDIVLHGDSATPL